MSKASDDALVYLNGEYTPLSEAKVSVLDRGFLFGDGVYEVIPVLNRKPFREKEHLARLQRSLDNIHLSVAMETHDWPAIFKMLIDENAEDGTQQCIYLQVTRGAAPTRQHHFPDEIHPTVFVHVSSFNPIPYETLKKGYKAITTEDLRWGRCDIKAITLLPNVLAKQKAIDAGCDEAILVKGGYLIEGSSCNIFTVKDGTLYTGPQSADMLSGITRNLILELAQENHIPVVEAPIPESQLRDADELWITASKRDLSPVIEVNGQKIGNGQAGPMWERMIALYYDYIDAKHS